MKFQSSLPQAEMHGLIVETRSRDAQRAPSSGGSIISKNWPESLLANVVSQRAHANQ